MKLSYAVLVLSLFLSLNCQLFAQNSTDDILRDYQNFLSAHRSLTFSGLWDIYTPAGFTDEAPVRFTDALYADSVQHYYALNHRELDLLEKHSFMVSDRIRYRSFGEALYTIYKRDLPVYISSDAILHALHMSYSDILQSLERGILSNKLTELLTDMHNGLNLLTDEYALYPEMEANLMDADLYITIPLILLGEKADPLFYDNEEKIEKLLGMIERQSAEHYPLFMPSSLENPVPRSIDFSQFTPRGHYTQEQRLTRYFRAMMWLGRTEFYLTVPKSGNYTNLTEDDKNLIGRHQTLNAYLINETLHHSNNRQIRDDIDEILSFLAGESDNVTAAHLDYLQNVTGFESAASLLDMNVYLSFKQNLEEQPFSQQKILSQILVTDPYSPGDIEPASAFLLLGQRFIIDSFVMANVVYDKVQNPHRMLPKSADVLFALGNNDALTVLEAELKNYDYASKLAALRYLLDRYEPEYWNTSFFNLWLNSIRQLNPPEDRSVLPRFMGTEAWTRKNMTTQLASWAQLRHDNLLYGKQSYTGGPICSYPHSYVEPVPGFFNAISNLASVAKNSFGSIESIDGYTRTRIVSYFENLEKISDKLGIIAQKQIDGIDTNADEKNFLKSMLHEGQVCGIEFTGWYRDLYFLGDDSALLQDYIVADVHTSPFDAYGNLVGWVMHAGTGPLNLAVLTAELGDGNRYAFVGPVMSYYEYVSTNFKRLTDEEWAASFEEAELSMRPEFVDSYLSSAGVPYYDHRGYVITSVEDDVKEIPESFSLSRNYPNPFNASTIIGFRIPSSMTGEHVTLSVYNVQGQLIETLLDRPMPAGNYTVRWETNAASGTYFYRLSAGSQIKSGRMTLIK